jgi:hypothetical protein
MRTVSLSHHLVHPFQHHAMLVELFRGMDSQSLWENVSSPLYVALLSSNKLNLGINFPLHNNNSLYLYLYKAIVFSF